MGAVGEAPFGPNTIVTYDDDAFEHRFTAELDGTTLRVEMWSGAKNPEDFPDLNLDDLASVKDELGNELFIIFGFGLTNAAWMEGNKGGEDDWSQGIFDSFEFGDGLFAAYGFRSKYGYISQSFAYEADEAEFSTFVIDGFKCHNQSVSCTAKFSREITARPQLYAGQELYVVTASGLSTSREKDWLIGNYVPITIRDRETE